MGQASSVGKMAAPCLTYSKLSNLLFNGRASGLVCSRWYRGGRNPNADRTPEQVERNKPEKIDQTPGPWKNYTDLSFWKEERMERVHGQKFDENRIDKMLANMDISKDSLDDMPVKMEDPYQKPFKKCIICEHNIELDYKNVQLLSQFVSPYTGRIYGRHVTGLCIPMQRRISNLISKAQGALLMPKLRKTPEYLTDPKLFNLHTKQYPYGK